MKTSWRSLLSSSSRHLNQDEYIRLSCTFSEDVFIKTNIFVLSIRLQGVFRTFSKDLQGVLQKRLEDTFKTFSRPLQNVFRCLTGLKVGVWLRVWNIELLSWKICLTSFLKKQKFVVDSKQSECLCGSSRLKGSLKKVLWEIFQNSQENICTEISFLIKLNSVGLQLHWKRVFSTGVFLRILQNL